MSEHSANLTSLPIGFAPGFGDIHVVNFDALAQANDFRMWNQIKKLRMKYEMKV